MYCSKCEQHCGRDEEATLVDGQILCLDCLEPDTSKKPGTEETCADVVEDRCRSRLEDLKTLLDYNDDGDDCHPELGRLCEYGLCFDYVEPETFDDQHEGYWRHQLSYGGPSQEIRFFYDKGAHRCYRIEFWHLDWYDGASVDITDDDTARELWDWFTGCGELELPE